MTKPILCLLLLACGAVACAVDPFGGDPRPEPAGGAWTKDPRGFRIGLSIERDPIAPGEETLVTFIITNTSGTMTRIPTPDATTLHWEVAGDADLDHETDHDGEMVILDPGATRTARVAFQWDRPGEYRIRATLRAPGGGFEPVSSAPATVTVRSE